MAALHSSLYFNGLKCEILDFMLQGNDPEDMQNRYKISFLKMAVSFPDPSQAEECFHKLNQMKVNNIFNSLALLLDESRDARTTRVRMFYLYF